MRALHQIVEITLMNLRTLPQRLGTSLVVVVGIGIALAVGGGGGSPSPAGSTPVRNQPSPTGTGCVEIPTTSPAAGPSSLRRPRMLTG